jgi:transcriptional regulator
MYIPEHFSFNDQTEALELIKQYSFGILITHHQNEMSLSHLPFLVEEGETPALLGHFARANDHWSHADGQESTAIFQGPHCYISPSWYVGKHVPTWNYAAVHVHGKIDLLDDIETKHEIVLSLSDTHERNLEDPWIPDYEESMLNAIVGFRLTIEKIEAKQKLSQNKTLEDRQGAITALRLSATENEIEIARLMEKIIT